MDSGQQFDYVNQRWLSSEQRAGRLSERLSVPLSPLQPSQVQVPPVEWQRETKEEENNKNKKLKEEHFQFLAALSSCRWMEIFFLVDGQCFYGNLEA